MSSVIREILQGKGPMRSAELMKLVGKQLGHKTLDLSRRKVCYQLSKLYTKEKASWLKRHPPKWKTKVNVWYYLKGQEELFQKKSGIPVMDGEKEETIKRNSLELRMEHTKKLQRKVVAPLYKTFLRIRYDEDVQMSPDELEGFAEEGPPFFVRYSEEGKGLDIPISLIVGNDALLEDYKINHNPNLFKTINKFKENYCQYWKAYYEIHRTVAIVIKKRLMLPRTHYRGQINAYEYWRNYWLRFPQPPISSSTNKKKDKKRVESVTTNLQFTLATAIMHHKKLFSSKDLGSYCPFSVKKQGEMYECRSIRQMPEKCYLRKKCKGRSKKAFYNEIEKKLENIFTDIYGSILLRKLSVKIRDLREGLSNQQQRIVKILENDLNVEILDGDCNYSTVQGK